MLSSELAARARSAAGDPRAALAVADAAAASLAELAGVPGRLAAAAVLHALLAELAEIDLTVARVAEPHLDALAILAENGRQPSDGRWGVFAAEAPDAVLRAVPGAGGWRLQGRKAWCSLAGLLDRALVTAHTEQGRQLFAVDLHAAGVQVEDGSAWLARGLSGVVSTAVCFDAVPAEPVGGPGWYLSRPGFAWGGIRVAACWYGGLRAVHRHLRRSLAQRQPADPIRQVSAGASEIACWSAGLALRHAAAEIDAGRGDGAAGELLAARTRAVVAQAAERVLRESAHALGPAPLAFDAEHARRVADLQLYVRQHHGERDLATLADLLARVEPDPDSAPGSQPDD